MRGLYIHIPFCKQICSYCDFPKMVASKEHQSRYLDCLVEEIKEKTKKNPYFDTIYIGGGTPNLLSLDNLTRLLEAIKPFIENAKEVTIECNPELVTKNQAALFKAYGINRISLGVQTIRKDALLFLGRGHQKKNVDDAIRFIRDAGIENISADFIFGYPMETIEDLERDLDYVFGLNLPHASFYSLILEEKTIFAYKLSKNEITLLEDDLVADMYSLVNERMRSHGYTHYEVSNYCKKGYESMHNILYWTESEYVGCGMGASGFEGSYRYTNYKTLKQYEEKREEDSIFIDFEEEKREYMMLGLRMLRGIDMEDYQKRFNSICLSDFDLKKHLSSGLLKIEGNRLFIPEDKVFIANIVYEEFV